MDVDQPGIRCVAVTPDLLQEQLTREYLPRLPGEGHEKVELKRGQGDAFIPAADGVAGHVNGDIGNPQGFGGLLVARAAAAPGPGLPAQRV